MLQESNRKRLDFPDGTVVKNLSASAGDTGSIPDLSTWFKYNPRCQVKWAYLFVGFYFPPPSQKYLNLRK